MCPRSVPFSKIKKSRVALVIFVPYIPIQNEDNKLPHYNSMYKILELRSLDTVKRTRVKSAPFKILHTGVKCQHTICKLSKLFDEYIIPYYDEALRQALETTRYLFRTSVPATGLSSGSRCSTSRHLTSTQSVLMATVGISPPNRLVIP